MIKFKTDWLHNNTPNLVGARVVLSAPSIVDYGDWAEIRQKNKAFLMPYEPQWHPKTLNKSAYKLRLIKQKTLVADKQGAFFFIRKDNKIIGGLNINNIHYGVLCAGSLGYWLGEGYQGQGYMNESLQLVIDYAFNTLGLKRLNAACLPDNERSAKLLLKAGFDEEGFAKNYLQINGRWQDHRLFGLVNTTST